MQCLYKITNINIPSCFPPSGIGESVALTRKLRKVGTSRAVVIPSDLAALCGLEIGDTLEFEYLGGAWDHQDQAKGA